MLMRLKEETSEQVGSSGSSGSVGKESGRVSGAQNLKKLLTGRTSSLLERSSNYKIDCLLIRKRTMLMSTSALRDHRSHD
jgi:hypothetical protein